MEDAEPRGDDPDEAAASPPPHRGRRASQRPSDLVWVGDHRAAEVAECYAWCAAQGRVHRRGSLADLAARPLAHARRVLVVRLSREPQNRPQWAEAAARHPRARWAHLLGSLCEGETRTGTPWPGFARILWHRWQDRLPDWLAAPHASPTMLRTEALRSAARDGTPAAAPPHRIALCAARFDAIAALHDLLAARGDAVVWTRGGELARGAGWTVILWDESEVARLGPAEWEKAASRAADADAAIRQAVMVTAPRADEWQRLRRAAPVRRFSKPIDAAALTGWLEGNRSRLPAPPFGPGPCRHGSSGR